MSWPAYVTNLEKGKGLCKYAAIYGRLGGCWAESEDKSFLAPTAEEIAAVSKAVIGNDMSVMGTGVKMGGNKFTCLLMEPELLICQGKEDKKDYSLVVAVSGQAVIIGFNPSAEVKTNQVRDAVESMKDYLKNAGF